MAIAHTLVAGAIAAKIGNPILAPTLSLASHFILDSIPHWDFGTNWRSRTKTTTGTYAIIDTIASLVLAWIIFTPKANPYVLALCMVTSLIPDWFEAPWYIFFVHPGHEEPGKKAGFVERFFYGVYKATNKLHAKASFPWGMITQIATVTFFLLVLR